MNAKSLKKSLLAVTVVSTLLGLSLGGCVVVPSPDGDSIVISDDSCFEHCEARNADGCGLQLDCRAVCDTYEEMDCIGEVEDYEACRDDATDELCGKPAECDDESVLALECIQAYCEANPDVEGNIFCF